MNTDTVPKWPSVKAAVEPFPSCHLGTGAAPQSSRSYTSTNSLHLFSVQPNFSSHKTQRVSKWNIYPVPGFAAGQQSSLSPNTAAATFLGLHSRCQCLIHSLPHGSSHAYFTSSRSNKIYLNYDQETGLTRNIGNLFVFFFWWDQAKVNAIKSLGEDYYRFWRADIVKECDSRRMRVKLSRVWTTPMVKTSNNSWRTMTWCLFCSRALCAAGADKSRVMFVSMLLKDIDKSYMETCRLPCTVLCAFHRSSQTQLWLVCGQTETSFLFACKLLVRFNGVRPDI